MASEAERMAAYTAHDHNVAWDALWDRCEKADAEIERLRAIIDAAMQRLNESGTGEMGVVETIHATHDILRQAREQKR
jgi:hypothetical protein